VTIGGNSFPVPLPFLVMATQNPIESEGTYALPEAQLDRFLVRIALGYPDEHDERAIARRYRASVEPLEAIDPVLDPASLPDLRDAARTVTVSDEVESYIVRLVRATRDHPDLQLGASPRASVALYRAAQASAFLAGRDFVLPDDVAALVRPVLTHRLMLDVDRELRGATPAGALAEIVERVSVGVGAGIG
jgi:MoxR-like ATPase